MSSKIFDLFYPGDADLQQWISKRSGETRLGQTVAMREDSTNLSDFRFHILGICESVGPRANRGFAGSELAFSSFVPRFLAMQSNEFLDGREICIHGYINQLDKAENLFTAVEELDDLVSNWTAEVAAAGGIPIVIGGGHNNAYGLIKGASQALGTPIDVVNLDPHADLREMRGRHSGNGFHYAHHEGFLQHYNVLGLHESYNNEAILSKLHNMNAHATFFEAWLDDPNRFYSDVGEIADRYNGKRLGIELDMDAIAGMPASARTSSGITVEQARFYLRKLSREATPIYLHLPEAAPITPVEEVHVGRTLAFLVSDFIKMALR